jgi:hypothetical protein
MTHRDSNHSNQADYSHQADHSNQTSQPKKNASSAKKHTAFNSNANYGNNGEHDFVLSHQEAEAASPEDIAVCGEEDPGEGLEFLVENDKKDE